VYSNGQKIGEVLKGQFIRLGVRPGTYQFALTEDAPPTEQLSISIGVGQKIFLRVTRTAFFIGRATEANASLRTISPSAAPAAVPQVHRSCVFQTRPSGAIGTGEAIGILARYTRSPALYIYRHIDSPRNDSAWKSSCCRSSMR